jgi:hypothetical protein
VQPLALAILLTSCARWPDLQPIRNEHANWSDAFQDAKVIVIARVISAEVGSRRLLRARLAVENVLQGDAAEGPVDMYSYATDLAPRERYVFFLTRDAGVLRTVWDHRQSAIAVGSGLHRNLPLPGRPAAERVAAMLLTPGDGMNPGELARELPGSVAFAMSHIGRWRTAKLLKQLSSAGAPGIRRSACEQLTEWYWGQDSCWDQLGSAGHGKGTAVSRAAEQQRRARTTDPDRWWKQMSAALPPAALLDELRLLTTHKDPRIRDRFCRFLRAHYPGEKDCGCGEPVAGGVQRSI